MEIFIDLQNVKIFMNDFCKVKDDLDIACNALALVMDDLEKSPEDRSLIIKKRNLEDTQWDLLIDATCIYQDLSMFFDRYDVLDGDIFLFRRLEKEFYNLPYIDAQFSFVVPGYNEEPPELPQGL